MINDCALYLSSIEKRFNSWNRYLLLSETMRNLRHRCASLSGAIWDCEYMCAHVGAYCIRTPYRPRRGRIIIWGSMGYTFIPCGMFVGRMQYAPTWVHVFYRWVVRMFSGRGVLHTFLYHTQQKRTIIWGFMVSVFIPYGMVVGRMQYTPTRVRISDR